MKWWKRCRIIIGSIISGIDIKTTLDALEKLRNGAWENFNNRRIYGWKVDSSGIDIKTTLDALEKLRNGAWENFNNRRIYGWKMGMGIWTALAAFIGVVLTGRICISQPLSFGTFIVFAILAGSSVVALHAVFMHGIGRAHRIDRDKEFFFEEEIMKILDIEFPPKVIDGIEKRKEKRDRIPLCEWLEFVQLFITIILVILAIIVLWIKLF
ncbi:MAG: hypothetical protein ABSF79_03855 [Smithellaceae bacterium]|jgi:hypothetical protein